MAVRLEGAVELRKALRAYTPDLAKSLQVEMAAALKPVVKQAREYLPRPDQVPSNWSIKNKRPNARFPYYDFALARRGIRYKTSPSKANRRGFRALASILNTSAAGAIFETAGRKSPDSVFVRNIRNKFGSELKGDGKMQGRAMFRAYEENAGAAQDGVIRAIENASDKFKAATRV